MRKNLVIAIACLLLIGCAKEKSIDSSTNNNNNNNNNSDLIGNWKFVSSHVSTRSLIEFRESGVNIATDTYSDYTTINNGGTITITADKFNSSNVTYSADTVAIAYYYENGQLLDSFEFPLTFTLPPTNTSSTYKKVGADSLYMAAGGFMNVGGSTSPNTPGGVRYKIEGDKMYMTQKYYAKGPFTNQGVAATKTDQATVVTTLQKQ